MQVNVAFILLMFLSVLFSIAGFKNNSQFEGRNYNFYYFPSGFT